MAHVGWGTEPYGSLNCRNGEFDSAHYFCVTLGLPVWFSYRGCYHVAPIRPDKSPEAAARLQDFADRYLGTTIAGIRLQLRELQIPLRDSRALKRMMLFHWFLWITGLMALMAVIATSAILPRGVVAKDVPWLIAFWTGFSLFIPSFAYYHYLRRARGRSACIRETVADRLGPFSDPADWDPALVMLVLVDLGVNEPAPEAIERAARQRLDARMPADALLVARLAMGLYEPNAETLWRRRFDELTDASLEALSRAHHTP
jgi:hypothetical protein